MLYKVTGNLLTNDFDFICHQVNCKGVMGAGLASQIRSKYPFVYREYIDLCSREKNLLGHVLFSNAPGINGTTIVNMFAQDTYGHIGCHTDYTAFQKCLNVIEITLSNYSKDWNIAFPYGIGCGLAGGDWNVIEPMLHDFAKKVKQDVYIVRRD